jgi:hypothetical protein
MSLILLISFLWAFLEGRREAQYFHYKWSNPNPIKVRDEHLEFTVQRSLYVIGWSLLSSFVYNWWVGLLTFITIGLCFSFFHNGSYYLRRNDLNPTIYKLRWKSQSETTTAKFSFDYKSRTIQFITGFIISIIFDAIFLFKIL